MLVLGYMYHVNVKLSYRVSTGLFVSVNVKLSYHVSAGLFVLCKRGVIIPC